MKESFVSSISLPEFQLWEKAKKNKRPLFSFTLEITARCNNNCRHCYINLPAGDRSAKEKELSPEEIDKIAGDAVSLGALWCLITGGEPFLREDFPEIYMGLKQKGLLVSVFTNATTITEKHIELFKKYPPRDMEVSVYGVTKETYEKVTQVPGSFARFLKGLDLLLENGLKVRFKAMALRSNVHELPDIARFCRERTKDYFRFDPLLHLRFDGDPVRNEEITSERLTPEEIVALEKADPERFRAMIEGCDSFIHPQAAHVGCDYLFHCGAGNGDFNVGYDGVFRLCSSLHHPDCTYDLRKGSLKEAWVNLVPKVRDMRSSRKEFLETCRKCTMVNLCLWCPAHAYLETGRMDSPVGYFCEVAHARAEALKEGKGEGRS